MQTQWTQIWEFNTAHFRVIAEVTDCIDDPANSFEMQADIDMVRDGTVAWFDARVRILTDTGTILGADYLSACAYADPLDLFRDHAGLTRRLRQLRGRTDRASSRERQRIKECLVNNIKLDPPVSYGSYGLDMVRAAVAEARKALAAMRALSMRAE